MKRSLISLLCGVLVLAFLAPTSASASAPRIPSGLYPHGAVISYRPVISNIQLDCLWGFFCEGHLPLFHIQSQNTLNRMHGWGQFAGADHAGHGMMRFELFASTYASPAWSAAAFDDLMQATHDHGYVRLYSSARLLPANAWGESRVLWEPSGSQDLIVMACWTGTHEVEAIVLFKHGSIGARHMAISSLARQVRAAVANP